MLICNSPKCILEYYESCTSEMWEIVCKNSVRKLYLQDFTRLKMCEEMSTAEVQ